MQPLPKHLKTELNKHGFTEEEIVEYQSLIRHGFNYSFGHFSPQNLALQNLTPEQIAKDNAEKEEKIKLFHERLTIFHDIINPDLDVTY